MHKRTCGLMFLLPPSQNVAPKNCLYFNLYSNIFYVQYRSCLIVISDSLSRKEGKQEKVEDFAGRIHGRCSGSPIAQEEANFLGWCCFGCTHV